jgi:ParB-like chromosome segregation protein Spo0J
MKIEQVKISELKPAEYNPRQMTKDQAEDLRKSLKKYGFVDPIIVNSNPERNNIIIGGHQRVNVAKQMGIEEVPIFYIDLSEDKEKELNLRLNKNLGEWDYDILANNFDIETLMDVGFSEGQLGLTDQEYESKDEDDLSKTLDSYLDGNIKQVVLFFSAEDFDKVIPRLEKIMESEELDNHTEVFLNLLNFYEDNHSGKK